MQSFFRARPAFTLVEMVVVLAILGIALAIAGPSLMRPVAANGLQSVVDRTRNIALRRAEPVTLVTGADGKWTAYAVRSGSEPVTSGTMSGSLPAAMRIDISAIGLCTSDYVSAEGSAGAIVLNPFACTVTATMAATR